MTIFLHAVVAAISGYRKKLEKLDSRPVHILATNFCLLQEFVACAYTIVCGKGAFRPLAALSPSISFHLRSRLQSEQDFLSNCHRRATLICRTVQIDLHAPVFLQKDTQSGVRIPRVPGHSVFSECLRVPNVGKPKLIGFIAFTP